MTNDAPELTTTSPAEDTGGGFDPREYVRVLYTYKWLVLGVAVAVLTGMFFWTMRQPSIYEAACTIQYDPHPPRPLGGAVEDVADPVGNFWATREFFETQNRIIASRTIAERVVQTMGLHRDAAFFHVPPAERASWEGVSVEAAARSLQARLTVEPIKETRLVAIKVRDQDPERAAALANAIADAYIEKTMEDRLGSTVSALNWLGEQLDNLRQELSSSELALHEFKREHNVLSVSMEDRRNLVAADIEKYNEALTNTRLRRLHLAARLDRLRNTDFERPAPVRAGGEDEGSESPVISTLRTEIRRLEAEREGLGETYGANHPQMRDLAARIGTLKENLREEIDAEITAAEADLREVRQVEGGLQAALDEAHAAGLELNLREIEYERLNRERANKEELYKLVLERNTETDLTRMLRTTHVRVVDRALPSPHRISPNMTTNAAGGAVGGIALGIALAFLLSRLDRRIKLVEEVEALGVPVLGVLPRMDADAGSGLKPEYGKKKSHKKPPEPPPAARDMVVHTHPMSAIAESCRTIRTNLAFMSAGGAIKTVVVTSANPREGKTTVASNLAIAIAQSGKRVLLVDTDLRRPRLHRAYGLPSNVGVTSYLVGEATLAEVTSRTPVDGLDVLACGPIPPNPSELLHSQRFEALLRDADSRYDRIIFDSPPLTAVTDAAVLAPQVDAVVLVVKADQTTRDAVRSALRQLRDVGARPAGGILNDVDTAHRRYAGAYYYYYRRDGYYQADEDQDTGTDQRSDDRPAAP